MRGGKHRFEAKRLSERPNVTDPDVRVLLRLNGGSLAHFERAAGRASLAVEGSWPLVWHDRAGPDTRQPSRKRLIRFSEYVKVNAKVSRRCTCFSCVGPMGDEPCRFRRKERRGGQSGRQHA